jgi:hypothetical protein
MRTEARFPAVGDDAGQYESFYIKAARPGGGRAVWIRHTHHKRPREGGTASLWLTLFDAGAPAPRAAKLTVPAAELSVPTDAYLELGSARLDPGRATGAISTEALDARWDLTFDDRADSFRHLPYERLYLAPLPRTKFLSPHPAAVFDGELVIDGERIAVDGWPGMIGHNWGAEHAERWVWVQASRLGGQPDAYLDFAAGRIKLGPVTTPWVANGMLRIDGAEHRLGGFDKLLSTKIDERPTGCAFELSGGGLELRGRVSAEPRNFVAWVYADPVGPEHNTLNCSIADLELEVADKQGGAPRRLEVTGAAAYEIGMRETDHGIPLQPFPDG